jgi:hypothetical protein
VVAAQLGGGLVPTALAADVPDKSDVALVLDFSASILKDAATRNRFGAALERIAARVDETSTDLVAGDATFSIVQFASKARDYPGCTDLRVLDSPATVVKLSACLRSVASAYRRGLDPALGKAIGIDTNYVAAMEQAAKHLPADAVRPVMVLFSDGKHDVRGVPLSQVQIAHDRLFGTRTPFALLPVGMGLAAKDRPALEAGLDRLRIIRDMPACVSGATFDWPQVVFESPDQAGNAVAVALQDATCTFTVAPQPSATPAPPPAVPGAIRALRIRVHDGQIDLTWAPPAAPDPAVTDYVSRCAAGDGDWIESAEGVSITTTTTVKGVPEASDYKCEVTAVGAEGSGPAVTATAAILAPPPAPAKPTVGALDGAVSVTVPAGDPAVVSGYHYECSADQGATWPVKADTTTSQTTVQVADLTNGSTYVCRAFAQSAGGQSEPSPVSDAVMPCGSPFQCTPVLVPVAGVVGLLVLVGLGLLVLAFVRSRQRGYVVAVVDVVHTANLGHGSRLGIRFVKDPATRRLTGLIADRGAEADIKIRHLGRDRFTVQDRLGRRSATSGESIITADSTGARHELVLRAFDTRAASTETTRV